MTAARGRVMYVVTDAMSVGLIAGELAWLHAAGWRLCVVGNGVDAAVVEELPREVERLHVGMSRSLSPGRDVRSLADLVRVIRRWRPDIVHASTPKGGLLGVLAARLCGVPHRLYLVRGLRYETGRGLRRRLLVAAERVSLRSATRVHAVSRSVVERGVTDGLRELSAAHVLRHGSSKGVDVSHFRGRPRPGHAEPSARRHLVPGSGPVVGFVGRIARDKGVVDLLDAMPAVWSAVPEARLLLVGGADLSDPVGDVVWSRIAEDQRVRYAGPLRDVREALRAMDVLALPSYREGFGNVVLEAAATGIPTVGYRSSGLVDAVVDGITGTLVPRFDVEALGDALVRALSHPEERERRGAAAAARARELFEPTAIWEAIDLVYRTMLANTPAPSRAAHPE